MTRAENQQPGAQHLTHDDVAHLVGDLEDATIAAILATGASYQDIEQAVKWAGAGLTEPRLNAHGMTVAAEQVFDILLSDPAYVTEDREGAR
ncbi:MAG TPA: hypothetical protein VG742_03625 [Dongiaceae bacterium]|nr:hypothetical protein [Dongiaceae bacterium]